MAATTLSLLILGYYLYLENDMKDVSDTITTAIGMSINDVEKYSQVPVKFIHSTNGDGYAEYHDNVPHDLKVVSGKLDFVLTNMKSIGMYSVDGKLQHIDDRPSARLMLLDDALRWSDHVIQLLDESGWKRDTDPRMTLYAGELGVSFSSTDELRKAFLTKDQAIKLKRIRIATWRNGQEVVNLEIARNPYFNMPKGELAEDQVYFATIYIGVDK